VKDKIYCINCKNWKETRPEIKIGWCSKLNKQTEWCNGEVWRAKNRFGGCPGFEKI